MFFHLALFKISKFIFNEKGIMYYICIEILPLGILKLEIEFEKRDLKNYPKQSTRKMHHRCSFYLHVTRRNGHAINNYSQFRETASFSRANARDNASSLVWHSKERSRQRDNSSRHPGIAIGRLRTRRSHPNVHNCESDGRFPSVKIYASHFRRRNRQNF